MIVQVMQINYSRLLNKLKAEVPDTTPKKSRIEKTFYPTEAQRQFLDVCGYKEFLNPPGFGTAREVNQFVTEHADFRKNLRRSMVTCHVQVYYTSCHAYHN